MSPAVQMDLWQRRALPCSNRGRDYSCERTAARNSIFSTSTERFYIMAVMGCLFVLAYPGRFWTIVLALACAVLLFKSLQFLAPS